MGSQRMLKSTPLGLWPLGMDHEAVFYQTPLSNDNRYPMTTDNSPGLPLANSDAMAEARLFKKPGFKSETFRRHLPCRNLPGQLGSKIQLTEPQKRTLLRSVLR